LEVWVILFLGYAVGIAGMLCFTLFFLPNQDLTQHFSFALNTVQLGVLSLLSFLVYRQETIFRSVFFQFWFLFAYLALIPAIFYGSSYWLGSGAGLVTFTLSLIVFHTLLLWTSTKVLVGYVFHQEQPWVVNFACALVVLPLCGWLYWPFWWSPEMLATLPTAADPTTFYRPIEQQYVVTNGVSILLLLAFFVHKLRTDRPIGVYADTLLYFFAVWVAIDTVEYVADITSVQLMSMTQWAAVLATTGMIVTLILRLKFKSQTISQYYESQCVSGDPRIDRRIGRFDRLIVWGFFDPKKVGERVFFGPGNQKMKVKRSSQRVTKNADMDG
jgi:hypothetical protein